MTISFYSKDKSEEVKTFEVVELPTEVGFVINNKTRGDFTYVNLDQQDLYNLIGQLLRIQDNLKNAK